MANITTRGVMRARMTRRQPIRSVPRSRGCVRNDDGARWDAPVPDDDRWTVALVREDRNRRRVESEMSPERYGESEESRADRPHAVTVAEQQHARAERLDLPKQRVDAVLDLLRRLAAWTAVTEELPAGSPVPDLVRRESFIVAVVDLRQRIVRLHAVTEARELRRVDGALHGTRQHCVEMVVGEELSDRDGLELAFGGERDVGPAGVLTGERPFRLTVSDQPDGHARNPKSLGWGVAATRTCVLSSVGARTALRDRPADVRHPGVSRDRVHRGGVQNDHQSRPGQLPAVQLHDQPVPRMFACLPL